MSERSESSLKDIGYTEAQMEEARASETPDGVHLSGVSGSLEADLGRKIVTTIRTALSANPGENAAYREWLLKLRPGDQLPRGRYFRQRLKTKPTIYYDE